MAFNSYSMIEEQISEACDAIHDGWYSNCTQAATVYGYQVPVRRLQRQWNESTSKNTQASTNAICEYIDRLDKIFSTLDDCRSCKLIILYVPKIVSSVIKGWNIFSNEILSITFTNKDLEQEIASTVMVYKIWAFTLRMLNKL